MSLKSEENSLTFSNQDLHIFLYMYIKYMHMHGLAIILRRLLCCFDKMLKTPSIFRFKDLLGFLLYTHLVFEDLVQFGIWDKSLFDSSCFAASQLYSSREAAKSSLLAYHLKESNQVKNNLKEFVKS